MSKELEERSELVDAMAGRCGADVAEAFRQGVIGPRQFREFLSRCSHCAQTEECRRLLAEEAAAAQSAPLYGPKSEPPDAEAPDYCRNKTEIGELRQRLQRALR